MKRIALAASAALLLLGTAQAQQSTMPPMSARNLYGELGYTFLKVDAFGTSTRPDALRGIIGYDFHPFFAVEGMGAWGVRDNTKNLAINGVPTNVTGSMDYMFGIWLKPKYDINQQAEVFGRIGWNHSKFKATSTGFLDRTETRDDLAWGVGANYRFTPQWYAGIDWMRYSNQSNTHADGLTLTVGYHW
jgi:opacity protein-like surface antigen